MEEPHGLAPHFIRRISSTARLVLAGLVLALVMPATPASADLLPLTFQIRSVYYGECAYPQSDAPHYLRKDPCSISDLSERWLYDAFTQQVSNSRITTAGKCLTYDPDAYYKDSVTMQTCDSFNPYQRWEKYTENGANYLILTDGSKLALKAEPEGLNWNVQAPGVFDFTKLTFPEL